MPTFRHFAILLPLMQLFLTGNFLVALGFDPIWFAAVITRACEMGLITPPVGLNLYILRGVSGASLDALGSAPFVFALLPNMALLTIYPGLALGLASLR